MKRFLAMLLAVVMVVSLLPVGVWAEGSGTPTPQAEMAMPQGETAAKHTKYATQLPHDHSATAGTDAHICEHCVAKGLNGDAAKPAWTAWSGTTLPKTTGHYYITGNLSNVTKAQIDTGSEDIVICLNGKTLTAKDWNNFYQLGGSNKVTVLDCTAHEENGTYVAGKLKGATQATVMFAYKKNLTASFTMYDGIITNSTRKESSGIKNGGAFAMQGGCTVNLFGGEISDCRANNGAAIFIQNTAATLNIDGAVIKNNTAITSGSAIYGNTDTWTGAGNNNITIKNAVITGNKTETAGNVSLGAIYVNNANQDDASLTFGGNCQITGNTDKDGAEYNLFLHNNAGKQMKFAVDGLSSESKIGVRVAEDRLAATDGLTVSKTLSADCSGSFQCNNSTHELKFENNVLVLKQREGHSHKVCNGDAACAGCAHTGVTYQPWGDTDAQKKSLPTSGSYYLTSDVTLESRATMDGTTLNLCLNGHTVAVKDGVSTSIFLLKNSAKLNITNCSDTKEGILTGAKSCAIQLYNTSAAELYNVVLEGNSNPATGSYDGGGAVQLFNSATMKAVSSKFRNNTAAKSAGAVLLRGDGNQVTLVNCEVKNNTASTASAIRVNKGSSLTLDNTVVENNQATSTNDYNYGAVLAAESSCGLTVQGATRITGNKEGNGNPSNLYLLHKSGAQPVVTVGAQGLSGNALIGVTMEKNRLNVAADRMVTAPITGADPSAYFAADNNEYVPILKGNVVVLEAKAGLHTHSLCKATDCTCENHGNTIFLPWGQTDAEKKSLPKSGNYYLVSDINLTAAAYADGRLGDLNLCLHGKTISGGDATRIMNVDKGSTLSITDCQTTGTITGGRSTFGGAFASVNAGCTVNLFAGHVTDNYVVLSGSNAFGGAIFLYQADGSTPAAVFNMYGGKITNNTTEKDGGAIYGRTGTSINIYGGEISGNTANGKGGAIYMVDGTLTAKNCSITGNTAAATSAICVESGKGSVTLTDCVIENNHNTSTSKYNYGALFVPNNGCTVTVEGQTRITGNTNGNNEPANVYMQNKAGVQMVLTVGDKGLSGNALIGFTMESGRFANDEGRAVTAKLNGKDVAAFFKYDTDEYEPIIKDDKVVVEEVSKHKHNLCNDASCADHGELKFKDWKSTTTLPDAGNYCLTGNVVLNGGQYIRGDLNLCLNGYTISLKEGVTGVPVFYMKAGDLTITDCKDTGKINGGVKNYGGVINVIEGSTFNLFGGTLTGGKVVNMDNDKGKGGAIYLSKAGTNKPGGVFNMYGGAISGNEAYRGGAVYLCDGSAMNMYGGTISDNKATYRGGAITNDGVVTINIQGGTITGNTAVNGAAAYVCGGAAMTVAGGEITKNTGTSAGGAILVESQGSSLTVTGGKIAENSTPSDGGAIYASRNTIFRMSGGAVENNSAANGGGIYLNETVATISGGAVKGNAATGKGGGIAIKNAKVSLEGGEISGNTAATLGGGVFAEGEATTLAGDLVIKDNQAGGKNSNLYLPGKAVFSVGAMGANAKIGISAERVYGAMSAKTDADCSAAFTSDSSAYKVIYKDKTVYLEAVEGHTHCLCSDKSTQCKHEAVSYAPWTDATALPREGTFYLTTDVVLSTAAFAANDLNLCLNGHTISYKEGGKEDRIINMKAGATLSISDCKETGKIAGGVHNYGGVINVNAGSTFNLYGGSLTGNKVLDVENDRGKGGAVYLSKTSDGQPGGVFNMYGGAISGNEAYRGGAVFACDGSTFNMYGGTVANNNATYRGGAIANEGAATINIHGGTFTGNTAKNGAVFYICNGATMTMTDGLVTKNTTTGAGSVLLIESKGTKVVIKGGKIADNSTPSDGTVYVSRNTLFEMSGGSIENNKAKSGAGVYVNESSTNISGGSIKGNKATGSGGGVYFNQPVSGLISGGNITHNQAESYGGGVYIYNHSKATISGGSVSYNTSVKGAGGGVCMMGGSLDLKGGTIGYNQNLHKSNKGGGIMMYGGTLYMTGGYIVGNKVNDGVSGAGICCTTIGQTKNGVKTDRPSKITMYGGTIADHVGNYGGGVILQSKTVMNVYGGTFRNNEAKGDGGAVYLNGKSVFNMYGGTMTGNKAANRGGAVCYFTNTTGEITGGAITDNYAGGYGGSIAAHGLNTKVTIKNMKLTGSKSDNYGGAVSITWNAALDMDDCEIYENEAYKGGAMYIAHKTTAYLDNVKIYKNTSEEAGGAINLDVGNNINFTNVKIMDNKSTVGNGGAIFTRANLRLKDCVIDGNTAGNNGGGIATGAAFTYGHTFTNGYVGRGQGLIIENTKVTNNSCVASGGGAYLARQNWNTIIDSEFTGNTCGETGSGLFVGDDLMTKGTVTVSGNTSKTEGYAVYFNENSYDGQSHSITTHEIGGNVIVKDNIGGEVMLCKDVSLGTTAEGYGEDTYFNITLSDGLLTNRVWGAYNYEGSDLNYTITYGTRSYDEPMEAVIEAETNGGNVWLYAGVGVFAAAVIAAVVVIVVKKKKAGTPAEAPQE